MPKRPTRIEGDTAYVTMTKGYVAIIDAVDVERVGQYNWSAKLGRNCVYAARGRVGLHHQVAGFPDVLIDHHDGDGLNNRQLNLRKANFSQNSMNSSRRSDNTSGFKGVCFCKANKKWSLLQPWIHPYQRTSTTLV